MLPSSLLFYRDLRYYGEWGIFEFEVLDLSIRLRFYPVQESTDPLLAVMSVRNAQL